MAVPATPARAAQRLEPSLSPVLFNAKTLVFLPLFCELQVFFCRAGSKRSKSIPCTSNSRYRALLACAMSYAVSSDRRAVPGTLGPRTRLTFSVQWFQGKLEAEYEMAAAEVRRPGLSGGIMLCVGRTVSAYAHTKIKRVRQHSAKSNQRFSTLHTKCTSRMHDCV